MVAVVDVILLALLLLFVLVGIKDGFVRSILGMAAVAVAVIAAAFLSGPVAQAVYDNFASAPIESAIAEQLPQISAQLTADNTQTVIASLPEAFVNAASSMGIDISDIAVQAGSFDFESADIAAEITEKIARPIAVAVLSVIVFVIIFLILDIVLQIVVSVVSKFFDLPVLKTFNRGFGGIVGAVKGVFFVVALAVLLDAGAAVIAEPEFVEAVNGSKIVDLIVSTDIFSRLALA